MHTLYFRFYLLLKDTLFKNIFDFTTAGELDYVVAVDHPHVLHYSLDFISVSFGIMDSIVEF